MEERHLSLSEVAQLLDKSERTIRRWIKSGRLRAYKPGRDYLIPESAIREFIEESEVNPKAQAPPSLELSFNDILEEERRELITDPGVRELRQVAHELSPKTPLDEALDRLSAKGLGALVIGLTTRYLQTWLKDPASSAPALAAATRFVAKTGTDEETALERAAARAVFLWRRVEKSQERQHSEEGTDAGEESA